MSIPTRILPLVLAVACIAPLSAAEDHHHHDHDAAAALGTLTLGGYTVVVKGEGAAIPGSEWHAYVQLSPAVPAPKAVRIWVGIDSGRGSAKARAEASAKTPGSFAAHVDVPKPLPAGAQVWVSIETAAGDTVQAAVGMGGK
jgi:hypothetical protein